MTTTANSRPKSTSFLFHVDDFRVHRIPGVPGAKLGSCFIRASELVNHLDLDDWLEVNPRVPSRSKRDVLTGHVIKGIRETLEGGPSDFALKNLGLFLLVEAIGDYERRPHGGRVRIRLSDPESHGLCNGGHTYAAIREYAESVANGESTDTLDDVWVRLHVFEGIDPEKVATMAEGLNRSKQVDDPSLMDLEGKFEAIKNVVQEMPGGDQIAYHQGDNRTYYVTEVIRALMFFNGHRYSSRSHPSTLYRQQKQMIDHFKKDCDASPSPIDLIIPHTHEILSLMDRIALATPDAAKGLKPKFEIGRMLGDGKKGSARAGASKHKNTSLHFISKKTEVKVPNGWLMVMLAAFRANVDWSLEEGRFEWKVPLDQLLPAVIDDLVRICVQEYRDNNVKPDEMARNASTYEQCYNKVELELYRRSAVAS